MPGTPKIIVNGLYLLILNVYFAVEDVICTYGVDPEEAAAAYQSYLENPNANSAEVRPGFLPAVAPCSSLHL
eukprot:2256807-Rhodomonas_salina.1